MPRRTNEDTAVLTVCGYQARVFADDAAASKIDDGHFLIACPASLSNGQPVLVDRYDVRNLLSSLADFDETGFESTGSIIHEGDESALCQETEEERQLDQERYRDLKDSNVERSESDGEQTAKSDKARPTAAIKWTYEDSDAPVMHKPPAGRQREILLRTAKFITAAANSAQAEITIQVKQGSNADFAFLHRSDVHNPYFEHVKELMRAGTWDNDMNEAPLEPAKRKASTSPVPERRGQRAREPPSPPPAGLGEVIERTAAFVQRNGAQFEQVLSARNKGDARFDFLKPWHRYHPYYKTCLQAKVPVIGGQQEERRQKARTFLAQHREARDAIGDPANGRPATVAIVTEDGSEL
ncbi:RNA-binding protein 26 [Sorochytrium milnesiophthora]